MKKASINADTNAIKEVFEDTSIESEVKLDTQLTDELREEGIVRDVMRELQAVRKKQNLTPGETLQQTVVVCGSSNTTTALRKNENYIKKETSLTELKIIEDKDKEGSTFEIKVIN